MLRNICYSRNATGKRKQGVISPWQQVRISNRRGLPGLFLKKVDGDSSFRKLKFIKLSNVSDSDSSKTASFLNSTFFIITTGTVVHYATDKVVLQIVLCLRTTTLLGKAVSRPPLALADITLACVAVCKPSFCTKPNAPLNLVSRRFVRTNAKRHSWSSVSFYWTRSTLFLRIKKWKFYGGYVGVHVVFFYFCDLIESLLLKSNQRWSLSISRTFYTTLHYYFY